MLNSLFIIKFKRKIFIAIFLLLNVSLELNIKFILTL